MQGRWRRRDCIEGVSSSSTKTDGKYGGKCTLAEPDPRSDCSPVSTIVAVLHTVCEQQHDMQHVLPHLAAVAQHAPCAVETPGYGRATTRAIA